MIVCGVETILYSSVLGRLGMERSQRLRGFVNPTLKDLASRTLACCE
jgi:hypothetical protein